MKSHNIWIACCFCVATSLPAIIKGQKLNATLNAGSKPAATTNNLVELKKNTSYATVAEEVRKEQEALSYANNLFTSSMDIYDSHQIKIFFKSKKGLSIAKEPGTNSPATDVRVITYDAFYKGQSLKFRSNRVSGKGAGYYIQFETNKLVFDGSSRFGHVVQNTLSNSRGQQWKFEKIAESGLYYIINMETGKYLTLSWDPERWFLVTALKEANRPQKWEIGGIPRPY